MTEMTLAEITRTLEAQERRISSKLSRELYDRDRAEWKDDVAAIRQEVERARSDFDKIVVALTVRLEKDQESRATMQRLVIGAFVSAILSFGSSLAVFIIGRL